MTFEEWWHNGCRSGEKEPHCFHKDFSCEAWLAKEAWQAAMEYGNKKNNSERNLISLCQKDHLKLDMEKHMRNRKRKKNEA